MKTSLNILRATNACTGGFGRQASFWTVRPKAKAIEYPIWLVGLTGTYDDLSWAINNSLIVDDADFKELKARTMWPMFQYLFWNSVTPDAILKASQKKAGDFQRDALQDALSLKDAEGAQSWMDKYARYKLSTTLFNRVANATCWTDPQQYLSMLTEAIIAEKPDVCLEHEGMAYDLDANLPGHDSRTMKPLKKAAIRRPASRYRDDDEDDTEGPAPTRFKSKAAKPAEEPDRAYFKMPARIGGRVVTKGEQFAYVCLNRDPWPVALQFLMDNNVPATIGSKMMLSKVSEDGKQPEQFHASINLSDPRTIFTLMHLLQGQDFDIFKALHIEQKLGRLERSLSSLSGNNRLDMLDEIVDDKDNEWDEARRRIVEDQNSAAETIAEAGPTGGAIRERAIRTTASGADRFVDGEETADRVEREYDEEDETEDSEL